MRWFKKFVFRLSTVKELFIFLWKNKLWWMMPMLILFMLLGVIILFAQSPAVAPFIYALF